MSLYDRIAAKPGGLQALASARLCRSVLHCLDDAMRQSGITQAELARRLGVRRSAVNAVFGGNGNVRVETLATYLYELGYELDVKMVAAGELRRRTGPDSSHASDLR